MFGYCLLTHWPVLFYPNPKFKQALRCLYKRVHSQLIDDVIDFCLEYFKNFDLLKSPTLKSTVLSYVFSNLHIKYIRDYVE